MEARERDPSAALKKLMRCSRAARQAAREPAELRDGVVPEGRFRLPVNGDLEFLSRQTKRSESLCHGSSGRATLLP
jgi:hypothetical protein